MASLTTIARDKLGRPPCTSFVSCLSYISSKRGQSSGHQGIGIPFTLAVSHSVLIPTQSVDFNTLEPVKT